MKNFFCAALFVCAVNTLQAQDETDAVLFSQTQVGTTARAIGTGGALGSIGADFAALGVNPATLGRYSKDEITLTPVYNNYNTKAILNNNGTKQNDSRLNFHNIGWVSASRNENARRSARSSAFAIGFNRLADFNRDYQYSGRTSHSSIMNQVARRVTAAGGVGYVESPNAYIEDAMAYKAFLINPDSTNSSTMLSGVPTTDLLQTKTTSTRGGINEITLGMGSNYTDRVYIGGSLGVPIVRYNAITNYREEDVSGNTSNNFADLQQDVYRNTTGLGFNAKLGLVYLPKSSPLRLGVAFHTPTWYNFTEEYRFRLRSNLENLSGGPTTFSFGDITTAGADNTLISEYSMSTPYKGVFSASYLFGKNGFLSADVDVVNYKSARIKFDLDPEYTALIRDVIRNELRTAPNIRLGAEGRKGNFSLRGGFASTGSPYRRSSIYTGNTRYQVSGGLGFRSTSFFIDGAYAYRWQYKSEYAYVYRNDAGALNQAANVGHNGGMVAITIGWKY